jgi:hypothetical protein
MLSLNKTTPLVENIQKQPPRITVTTLITSLCVTLHVTDLDVQESNYSAGNK